ncbi:hypothetical protein [Propionicimonas sp.]|nr:hypothetical protein [Propionicimonas sp.]
MPSQTPSPRASERHHHHGDAGQSTEDALQRIRDWLNSLRG